jgi:hypothetical protein
MVLDMTDPPSSVALGNDGYMVVLARGLAR